MMQSGKNNATQASTGKPLLDLVQIYPCPTNNLDIFDPADDTLFRDPKNFGFGKGLHGLLWLRSIHGFSKWVLFMLSLSMLFLFIAVCMVLVDDDRSVFVVSPLILLIVVKLVVLLRFIKFSILTRKNGVSNSYDYHRYGRYFFYSFYADCVLSLFIGFCWLLVALTVCMANNREYCTTNYFGSNMSSAYTWFVGIHFCVYGIVNYNLVCQNFDRYYKQWAYNQFNATKDVKYCINYHYTQFPVVRTAVDSSGNNNDNNDSNNNSNCKCCNMCLEPCCCLCGVYSVSKAVTGQHKETGNNDRIVCGLKAISLFNGIIMILGVNYAVGFGLVVLILGTLDIVTSFVASWLIIWFVVLLFYFIKIHFDACCYGNRLLNYPRQADSSFESSNCSIAYCCGCNTNKNNDDYKRIKSQRDKQGRAFYFLSQNAMKAHCVLALFYCIIYIYYVISLITVYVNDKDNLNQGYWDYWYTGYGVVFWGLVPCWLEFEAIKLIDAFIKTENYKSKRKINSIDIDKMNFLGFTDNMNQASGNNGGLADDMYNKI